MALTTITQKVLGSDTYAEKKLLATDINQIREAIQTGALDIKPNNISMEGNEITADAGQNWIRRHNNTFEYYSGGSWREPTSETILGFTAGENITIRDAVYVDPSDGKVYKCTLPRYTDWVGLAKTSASTDESIEVYNNNAVVGGFTGLEKGKWYGIASTPGELIISEDNLVAFAIDDTQLVLFKSPPDSNQDDLINENTKIFCELLNSGDILESSISKIISNTGLSGISNNAYTDTWANKLPDFSSFLNFNNNINKTTDGDLDIFYLNTSGNLIAGRYNLLTDTFTQTHSISSSDFPVAAGDATYNVDKSEKLKVFMLTESDTLIYTLLTTYDHDASPDSTALFIDAKVYNSSGTVIQTYTTRLLTATSGDSINSISVVDNIGYYTSGNIAKAYCPICHRENDVSSDDESYYPCNLLYNGSSFSATTGAYINYVYADRAYIDLSSILLDNDILYIHYKGKEDDGGSVDEELIKAYIYAKNLITSAHTTVFGANNYTCENNHFFTWVVGDAIFYQFGAYENDGWEEEGIGILINGSSVFYRYDSDSSYNVTAYHSHLLMPEGYEVYAELKTNGISKGSIFKAYNRIEGTSANITEYSAVGSSGITTSVTNMPVYIFKETDGTKHFCDINSTGYRVYDRTEGEVNFNDDITDTYIDKVFTYYTPFINSFWSEFIASIDTNVTVTNGVTDTVLNANKWDYYGDTITEINLTINSSKGKVSGTGNLSYYMIYE